MKARNANKQAVNKQNISSIPPPSGCREAVIRLLPTNSYNLIILVGILAGIGYYTHTQNPWLLTTFLSALAGKHLPR